MVAAPTNPSGTGRPSSPSMAGTGPQIVIQSGGQHQRVGGHTRLGQVRDRVAARRGRNIGVVAAARELTELVFYGLRDGRIRCLDRHPGTPSTPPGTAVA